MSGISTPPNKRVRSPSPTPQGYYKSNNPPYSQSPSKPTNRKIAKFKKKIYILFRSIEWNIKFNHFWHSQCSLHKN